MDNSYASIFQDIISKSLSDSSEILRFMVMHKRVKFKLWAAKHFLSKLKQIERKHGALGYAKIKDKTDLNLDAFLYETIGAFDTLLQEINIAFRCNEDIENVKLEKIIPKLPRNQLREKLGKLKGDCKGWFWKLREYRNHSAHRSVISFYTISTTKPKPIEPTDDPQYCHLVIDKIKGTYLIDNPRDINSGKSKQEVIPYCSASISNMEKLIEEIYEKCINELKCKE